MKVLLTAAQFSSNISGLQRHAINLVRCLLQQKEISKIHFVLAPWQREMIHSTGLNSMPRVALHVADMKHGVLSRNLWYYHSLPKLAAGIQPDIVHLSYPVPVNASAIPCPIFLTLHDLYPYEIPENFGFPKVLFNRLILQQCLRSVEAIACVSRTTLQSLKKYTPSSVWRNSLYIPNCVEAEPSCADDSPIPFWRGEPFLLTVSQHRRNKNIPLLIRVLDQLVRERRVQSDTKLVVIGIPGPETEHIHQLVSEFQMQSRVVFLEGLPETSLQWCYRHCEVLAAPSETEGFGLSVAEGILAGCRIVCSDIPAFREIDEKHCRFVAMGDGAQNRFADAITDAIRLPRPAPGELPQFSARTLGAQYVHAYRKILPQHAHSSLHTRGNPVSTAASEGHANMTAACISPLERNGQA